MYTKSINQTLKQERNTQKQKEHINKNMNNKMITNEHKEKHINGHLNTNI